MKLRYNSPVVLTYALLSLSVLLLGSVTNPGTVLRFFSAPAHTDLASPVFYFRLVSYVFGHAGWDHYIGNLMLILLVGPLLEEKYGSGRLLVMAGLTTLITSLSNLILFHASVMGGSGLAFMLILLASFSNIGRNEIPLTFLVVATLFLGQEIIGSLRSDQVSQFSHLLGGLIGALFGLRGRP